MTTTAAAMRKSTTTTITAPCEGIVKAATVTALHPRHQTTTLAERVVEAASLRQVRRQSVCVGVLMVWEDERTID